MTLLQGRVGVKASVDYRYSPFGAVQSNGLTPIRTSSSSAIVNCRVVEWSGVKWGELDQSRGEWSGQCHKAVTKSNIHYSKRVASEHFRALPLATMDRFWPVCLYAYFILAPHRPWQERGTLFPPLPWSWS
jgi:hypothetical protein